jgi:hypothetical protein
LLSQTKNLREKIKAVANNQAQITDCSHLFVFAALGTHTQPSASMTALI